MRVGAYFRVRSEQMRFTRRAWVALALLRTAWLWMRAAAVLLSEAVLFLIGFGTLYGVCFGGLLVAIFVKHP